MEPIPSPNCFHHFLEHAIASPDRIALRFEDSELDYGRLLGIAESIRAALPEGAARIGILAHRSPIAYAGVQAILAHGAAFVPLHPQAPTYRNASILDLAGAHCIVVGRECTDALVDLLDAVSKPLEVVLFDPSPDEAERIAKHPRARLRIAAPAGPWKGLAPSDPIDGTAYILFTSGSTGEPKGVRILHSNLESYVRTMRALYPMVPEDRLTQFFDLNFDPSIHDQFMAWSSGASLVVFPDRLILNPLEFASRKAVTVWCSIAAIPAFLDTFRLSVPGALPGLRLAFFGGEKLTWSAVRIWRSIAPNCRISNLYGLTETTISVTGFEIPPGMDGSNHPHGSVPIGKPFPGQRIRIVPEAGGNAEPGEPGELWVSGDQVSPGYLDPRRTVERFVEEPDGIWFRTGDIVVSDREGRIDFIGRDDHQVKVMGYRVELGEIEAALMEVTGAAFAVADVCRSRSEMEEIVCILPKAFAGERKRIRNELGERLESHLIPRIWRFEDELPRTPNGKLDRKALRTRWKAESVCG